MQHEQQHQELLVTDIKYILGNNPLLPKYNDKFIENPIQKYDAEWIKIPAGLYEIGHQGESFCYDNDRKRPSSAPIVGMKNYDKLIVNNANDQSSNKNFKSYKILNDTNRASYISI